MKQTLRTVKAGATFLDKKFPGWAKKIDPTILELKEPGRCILGQLYGDYDRGVIKLGPKGAFPATDYISDKAFDWATKKGFDTRSGDYDALGGEPEYEQLNCAWMLEIAKRLSPKVKRA